MGTNPDSLFGEVIYSFISPKVGYREKLDELHRIFDVVDKIDVIPSHPKFNDFITCLLLALSAPPQTIRATGLRLARLFYKSSTKPTAYMKALLKRNASYFISGSVERFKTTTKERIQAMKLIQAIIELDPLLLPRGIGQTLVSLSKQVDDPLLYVGIKLLTELAISNPALVESVGGMKVLFHSIVNIEKFFESFQSSLIFAATYLLNDYPTRKYVPLNEISLFIEPFTDTYESSQDTRKRKWTTGRSAIVHFLSSWTGVITLTSTPLGLEALVTSLRLQDMYLNDITLDVIFMMFHFPVIRASDSSFNRAKNGELAVKESSVPEQNLLNNYLAILLSIMNEFHLIEELIKLCSRMNARTISEEGVESRAISKKATLLIAELLHLSNLLLPSSQCAKLQGLPTLMRDSIDFSLDPHFRSFASTSVSDLEKLALIQRTTETDTRKVDYFDEVKKKFDANMDESTLKQKLNDSVLLKKDFNQWNWELISELIEGPLSNPIHFTSPLGIRFIKKILSFFRPSNKIFPTMPAEGNEKYGKIGCSMIELIIEQGDPSNILSDNQLMIQLFEMLRDVLEEKKTSYAELLSSERLMRTMAGKYFDFLGTMSKSKPGLDILNKHRIFEVLPLLSVLRDDLCTIIIQKLDYNTPGPSRVVLAKSLNAPSQVMRYLATKQLQSLLRAGVSDFSEWGIRFLVQKLSDENVRVSSFALGILEEASHKISHLESLINKRAFDVLSSLGKSGKDLLTRFLSRSSGFNYLLDCSSFIENELVFWKATGYVNYVKNVESALADAFASNVWRKGTSKVSVPVHLYGELVQTKHGIKLLEEKGDLEDFLNLLCSDKATSLQKRGALWVLGHIGKSKLGYKELFVKYDVLKIILHISKNCSCLSVRGTCFYILGLICSTRSASKALQNLGWESKRDSCICVPRSIKECGVFTLEESNEESWNDDLDTDLQIEKFGDERDDIVAHFINLSCKLTFDKSVKALKQLKLQHPEFFRDFQVQHQIFQLLEQYQYQLAPRRFFSQIFDVYWSQEKLEALPEYKLNCYMPPSSKFAYFPPFQGKGTWATVDKASIRKGFRGTVGARRPSSPFDKEKQVDARGAFPADKKGFTLPRPTEQQEIDKKLLHTFEKVIPQKTNAGTRRALISPRTNQPLQKAKSTKAFFTSRPVPPPRPNRP